MAHTDANARQGLLEMATNSAMTSMNAKQTLTSAALTPTAKTQSDHIGVCVTSDTKKMAGYALILTNATLGCIPATKSTPAVKTSVAHTRVNATAGIKATEAAALTLTNAKNQENVRRKPPAPTQKALINALVQMVSVVMARYRAKTLTSVKKATAATRRQNAKTL